jgi:uncharacterized membrane protein
VVLRTLKPEERKVVSVLDAHGGAYLQKFITKEAGLSRLKTHRVVAALSERGIVHVEERGEHERSLACEVVPRWDAPLDPTRSKAPTA